MNFATIGQNIVKLTIKYWDKFLITGLGYSLSLAAITVAVGAILGSLIALLRMSKIPPLRWIAAIYTEIIRRSVICRSRRRSSGISLPACARSCSPAASIPSAAGSTTMPMTGSAPP